MKRFQLTLFLIITFAALSGCAQKMTPEEVAHGFWQAVVDNDLDRARELATPATQKNVDVLDNKEQMLKRVEVGTSTIAGSKATVPTTLIGDDKGKETRIELTTYLAQEKEEWKVEADRTVNTLLNASLENMLQNLTGDLSELGGALNQSITTGLREFLGQLQKSVPALKQELGNVADEEKARNLGKELGEVISRGLGDAMKEFSKGLDDLQKELDKAATEPPAKQ